jgi:CheY-like chemotaxis protein
VQLQGVRVLVVDDHEDTLELERMVLSSEGADVRTARSVAEALTVLSDFPADVAVTDISMPERAGFEMLRQLRLVAGRTGKTPAIVTTAHAEEVMRAAAAEAGFALFVAKPAEPSALVRGILNVVGNLRERPEES